MDYVGIDLHKRESQICVLDAEGRVREKRIKTDRARFEAELSQLTSRGSRILIEASTESMWAAPALRELGYEVIVGDPNYAPMYGSKTKRKIKTDRRDARALAEACKTGNYRIAHQPSPEAHQRRNLLTAREQLVRMRINAIVTVRALLRQHGYRMTKGQAESFASRVRELTLTSELRLAVLPLLAILDGLAPQISTLEEHIKQIAANDPRVHKLTQVFGVGPITAVGFQAAIDDPKRFRSAHKAEAYLGMVPGESSSGDGKQRTGITKTGSHLVRWLLVQAALTIMRVGKAAVPGLHAWAHAVGQRRGGKVARVALARRLAGILFAMLRDGASFDATRFSPRASQPQVSSS